MLIESHGPSWFYGTGSEHSALYQYQVFNASNVSIKGSPVFPLQLILIITTLDIPWPYPNRESILPAAPNSTFPFPVELPSRSGVLRGMRTNPRGVWSAYLALRQYHGTQRRLVQFLPELQSVLCGNLQLPKTYFRGPGKQQHCPLQHLYRRRGRGRQRRER